jgi:hypothetical protein
MYITRELGCRSWDTKGWKRVWCHLGPQTKPNCLRAFAGVRKNAQLHEGSFQKTVPPIVTWSKQNQVIKVLEPLPWELSR